MHKTHQATFYRGLWKTIEAINLHYPFEFPWGDTEGCRTLADEFYRVSGYTIPGCVLALDGLAVKIKRPTLFDTLNPMHYWCRKGFFAINCQAGCDAQLRFRWASMATCGSTHDSTAFKVTQFAAKLDQNSLPPEFYCVGDDAYGDAPQLLTPIPGRGLSVEQDAYNFYQSKTRITIERAFGVLVARFGCLWRPMQMKISSVTSLVLACMKVYNLCVTLGEGEVPSMATEGVDLPEGGIAFGCCHFTSDLGNDATGTRGTTGNPNFHRDRLVRSMQGLVRPPHSLYGREAGRSIVE